MEILNNIYDKVRQNKLKKIILPEYTNAKILQSAATLAEKNIVTPVFIGDKDKIAYELSKHKLNISGIQVLPISQYSASLSQLFVNKYRIKKELTPKELKTLLTDPIHLGAGALELGLVDGMVAGADATTADVIRGALRIIGLSLHNKTLSSFFIMLFNNNVVGNQALLMADCAVIANPTSEQLVDIAYATSKSAQKLLAQNPSIAMLSFSTHGSAQHSMVEKVTRATVLAKKRMPDINIVGEVQLDAALVESVAQVKFKQQSWLAPANILIFPDLNSGNIGYKLCQRFAGAQAIGPIFQGLNKPVNDLSRGATIDDIVNTAVITALQANK